VTPVRQPDWLTELIRLVQELCIVPGRDSAGSVTGKARRLGRVQPDVEMEAGWFWLGLGDKQSPESDQLESGYLAPAEGAEQHMYQIIETLQDGNILKVRVAEHAPADGLFLWVPRRAPGLLEQSLVDGLSSIKRFDLVARFATGQPDPLPAAPGLNHEQSLAQVTCRSPGVHLVWGPPGTGKTRVIAAALQDVIESGKSALLVSGTNVAVDNALERAAVAIQPRTGVMVRVGNPHLPTIADNPAICLQKIVRDRQETLERQRHQLQEQIGALWTQPDVVRLDDVRALLDGFELDAYRAAADRVALAGELCRMEGELSELRAADAEIAETVRVSDADLRRLLAAAAQAGPARSHLDEAACFERQADNDEYALDQAKADVLRLEGERSRYTAELEAARARRRFGHGHLKDLVRGAAQGLQEAIDRRDALGRRVPQLTLYARTQARAHRDAALPWTRESIAQLDADLRQTQERYNHAAARQESQRRRTRELSACIDDARRTAGPSPDDHELVSRAKDLGLPRLLKQLPELERRASVVLEKINELEGEHERVVGRMRREAAEVRQDIVSHASVVAATLAMARLLPEVREREYDFVIVDEVAFALPPEVLYAASRASAGVTLLGDFLQNAPIPPAQFENAANPAVQRWYQQDCFGIFGIRDAVSARAAPGCVTLARQYRFGPAINELANTVAYRGVLQAARPDALRQEIVLVDVGGLGEELASVRHGPKGSGRWWPVGALLAQALAAASAEDGVIPQVGIVVPYRLQADLVQDLLNESGANPQIEVGTSHRFQGREFDTVIFDLVEDGRQRGWVASGTLEGTRWEASGLRLFNVGITRARRKLYLIANAAAVGKARTGPLRGVRHLLGRREIQVVRAADVLRLPEVPADPVAGDIWRALRGHATLIDLYDEDILPTELASRFDKALQDIWLWSPWVGRRSEELLPHLRDAQDRHVTVRPVILPRDKVTRHLAARHSELAAQVPATVYLWDEHQKIIVIDRRLTFIGSMNVLAHRPGTRHEIMALFQSTTLAERILEHERADELAKPPECPRCGKQVRDVRKQARRLTWMCRTEGCGWTRAFPDRKGTRNQPSR
jgi:AAA domain/PLD-like domain